MKRSRKISRNRKWLALLLSCALLGGVALALTPIRAADEEEPEAEQAMDAETQEAGEAPEAEDVEASAPEGEPTGLEELFQFNFQLAGKDYQLPCPLQEFLDNGWVFQSRDDESRELYPGNTVDIEFGQGDERISLTILNRGRDAEDDENRPLKDGEVIGVAVALAQNAPEMKLPQDVGFDTTHEALEATFGRPNRHEYMSWVYGVSDGDNVKFGFDDDKGGVTAIKLWHPSSFQLPENTDGIVDEWPQDLPDPVRPTELDPKLVNGVYQLGGKFYTFPTPLALLLQDGWQVLVGPESLDSNAWYVNCVLYKGNEVLRLSLENLLDREVPLELGYIYNLRLEDSEDQRYGESLVVGDGIGDGAPLAGIFAQVAALEPQIQMQGDNATILIDFPKFFQYKLEIVEGALTYIEMNKN